ELLGHVVEPVESTHLVGAVVGAVAGADATVVGHLVQALVAVRGGGHRAHRFARRVVAVLAHHRHEHHPGVLAGHLHPEVHGDLAQPFLLRSLIGHVGAEVAVQAQPVHLTASAHLVLAHHGDVVLHVAGRHAGTAAHAAVQVDAQPPAVAHAFHRVLLPQVELRHGLLVLGVDHTVTVHVLVHGQAVGRVVGGLVAGLVHAPRGLTHHAMAVHVGEVGLG